MTGNFVYEDLLYLYERPVYKIIAYTCISSIWCVCEKQIPPVAAELQQSHDKEKNPCGASEISSGCSRKHSYSSVDG